jgi:hypothetical protein
VCPADGFEALSDMRLHPVGADLGRGRFDEILADDFLCNNPEGSLIEQKVFLKQTAQRVTISNLEAQDVNVRIMGDVATSTLLVRAYIPSLARVSSSSRPVTFKPSAFW